MSDKCGIYSIENKLDNKKYYGSTTSWYRRKSAHKKALMNDKHPNIHLQRAWNKFGANNFEFNFELKVYEPFLTFVEQNYLDNNQNGYNIAKVAGSSMRGKNHSIETRNKMKTSHKGLKPNVETKERMSASHKGIKLSAEAKEKIRNAQIIFSNTEEGKTAKALAGNQSGLKRRSLIKK